MQDSPYKILTASNVVRPQDKWREDIDNSYGPFIPKLREKVHAKQPLDPVFVKAQRKAEKDATMAAPLAKLKTMSKEMESHMAKLGIRQKESEGESVEEIQYARFVKHLGYLLRVVFLIPTNMKF